MRQWLSERRSDLPARYRSCKRSATRRSQLSPDDYGTTIVTYEEQCRGRANGVHQAKTGKERLDAYYRLSESLRFFSAIAVWEYTATAESHFIAMASLRLGTKDRLIEAIALANNATVLTRNRRDFERVPGLLVKDWTEPDLPGGA